MRLKDSFVSNPSITLVRRRRFLRSSALLLGSFVPRAFADDSTTLRIGFQKGGGLLGLLKAQGNLERRLASQGWGLRWSEFPAGPQLLEALSVGSVDFGYTGAPPPIFAQAASKDLVYVGAEPGTTSGEAIVVKPDSPLKTLAELKGKRVAVQKGSSANYLLVAALENAGIAFSEIHPIYLTPADARAAFEANSVDAWSIWDPYLAAAQSSLQVRVVADYTNLLQTNSFYESATKFATQQPKIVGLVLEELAKAGEWASRNTRAVSELLAPQVGLPVEVVEVWQKRTHYGVQPIDASITATQQRVADTFFKQELIPRKVEVASAVWHWQRA
ncbi:MAG: aliphatic sulfonate ABC transporter substrate-binding protein [Burkholderiaceae bacterium]|jgi:sulfonate transport system substrate-binding protein